MRLRLAFVLSILTAAPALATEAVTYKGTIGKLPIVVELAEPDLDGRFLGRYAYLAKGGDIPLHGSTDTADAVALAEEAPCAAALCKTAEGEIVEKAPVAANWSLRSRDGGRHLAGEWKDIKSGKTLPVALERVAERTLPDGYDGFDALDPTYMSNGGRDEPPTSATLPYDVVKMEFPREEGAVERLGDGSFRLDTDRRTDLSYPRIVTLPGGNIDKANDYLAGQRLRFSLDAFSCMSQSYLGFGWWDSPGGEGGTGYDGGATVRLELLTPRLIGITEAGSYYCGGAHPNNFSTYRLGDIETGQPIGPESLLRGWIARDLDGKVVDPDTVADKDALTYGPDDALLAFVNQRRSKADATREAECGMDDLVRTNLGVYFTQTEMIFILRDLPHAIFACGDDLVKIPLGDARPLLTEDGAKYLGLSG